MKRTLTLLLAFLVALPSIFAQETPDYLQITGKVVDGSSGKPIHYASVNLAGNSFYIRDQQDIRSLAVEIAALTKRQQRGRGLRMA